MENQSQYSFKLMACYIIMIEQHWNEFLLMLVLLVHGYILDNTYSES